MDIRSFESRKKAHLRQALNPSHQAQGLSGFDSIRLIHHTLPELDFTDVRLTSRFLGKTAPAPFFLAGMTAGHPEAREINSSLASACQRKGWVFGLGSLRRDLENPQKSLDDWARFRERFPNLRILANFGISQLSGSRPTVRSAIHKICAVLRPAAIAVHANALQEALQPEGTPTFKGAIRGLAALSRESRFPIVLKETGCGFSRPALNRLAGTRGLKLAALDVSGLGGTHWGRVEGARSPHDSIYFQAAQTFSQWGEPTVPSIRNARKILPQSVEVWASGGLRSGIDAAKAIALGARQVGYAQPALLALQKGQKNLERWMNLQEFELRVALFCMGCKTPLDLCNKESVWTTSGSTSSN